MQKLATKYIKFHSAKAIGLVVIILSLTGCSCAPSIVLFGASFPDWLICSGIGVIAMTLMHTMLRKGEHQCWLEPAVIVYPCVTALSAMLTWLLFFTH
ncbi:YtcA family lipoprotein [Hafnia alvei]|jgi:hypothetical protein|uniref:YtcA family lipoprotein n=1 Tax=Hafnia alvei TaxID=569 RepID=UPI001033D255|nr:YtcA family lipoprotein [Hafnia alvei]MDU7483493.1 YtcA family lipoprotein [Hafnia alvei]MEB7890537.1 YtcA family lipoprotein [Hafnia alvei]TBL87311.1 hypothetical protein EYY95_11175 [Hafnia alvei]WNN51911.1 YtcA family lipoprotein [Hafnia alvei]